MQFNHQRMTINPNREMFTENQGYRKPSAKDVVRCRQRRTVEALLEERAIERAYSIEGLIDE